jgi:aryl carrier-like protein
MERRTDATIDELLHHERYTPEELSRLLGIGLDAIRHAAFAGELQAEIIEHDILHIRRADVLAWLSERGEIAHDSREPMSG